MVSAFIGQALQCFSGVGRAYGFRVVAGDRLVVIFIIAEYCGRVLQCVNIRCFRGESLLMLLTPS